jgi:hypothetical protein
MQMCCFCLLHKILVERWCSYFVSGYKGSSRIGFHATFMRILLSHVSACSRLVEVERKQNPDVVPEHLSRYAIPWEIKLVKEECRVFNRCPIWWIWFQSCVKSRIRKVSDVDLTLELLCRLCATSFIIISSYSFIGSYKWIRRKNSERRCT